MSGAASPSDLTVEPPIRGGTGSPYYRAPLRPFSPQSVHQTYIGPVPLLSLGQQQHRLYHSARGRLGGRAVDVGKIVTRDEPVEPHPARHEKIDEARDEVSRSAIALDHAAHNPAALQEAHLRAGAGVADQDAGAENIAARLRQAERRPARPTPL